MGLLIGGDLLQVGIEWVSEASTGEGSLGVVGKTVAVEGILQVLESQSIVEDITVVASLTRQDWSCGNGGSASDGGESNGGTHVDI